MLRIHLQCPPSPNKRFLVFSLIPIRDGDLHQNPRRTRIASERLLFGMQTKVKTTKRFLERPILQQRLGVVRIDFERTLQAALRRRPSPLAEEEDRAQSNL